MTRDIYSLRSHALRARGVNIYPDSKSDNYNSN